MVRCGGIFRRLVWCVCDKSSFFLFRCVWLLYVVVVFSLCRRFLLFQILDFRRIGICLLLVADFACGIDFGMDRI